MKRVMYGLVIAGVIAAVATTSQAGTVTYNGLGLNRTVEYDLNGDDHETKAGQLLVTFDHTDYKAYCVDLDHTIKSSWSASSEPVTILNGGKAVAFLYDTFASTVDTSTKAAALQVAIWEVLKDWGGSLNLNSGHFELEDSYSVKTQAQQYLNALPANLDNYQTNSFVLKSGRYPRSQHLIVPEPGTVAVMAMSLPWILARRTQRARA